MSHTPLRKETDCLNCGAIVQGRFCHVCGQENLEPKETVWHMFTHFLYDITHFDGSFFVTVKDLLFKPGFLSREYMLGRRKKYLHPVRMYVFTSAVFFLVFFSLFHVSEKDVSVTNEKARVRDGLKIVREEALKNAKTKEDSAEVYKGLEFLEDKDPEERSKTDTVQDDDNDGGLKFTFGREVNNYETVKEYDSVQQSLPKNKRDAGITKMITRKSVSLNEKYKGDQTRIATELINKFLHSFPYLLFVSLPLYALFLKLLYMRHRKQYYFADHGVFLIHLYIFTFLFMLFYIGLEELSDNTGWGFIGIIETILILTGLFYALKAMKNFYRQGWGKTISKFILFNILCFISLVFLFVVFLLFSLYQI
ncbi:MAG TPA: DUF3667 domain-containing protein [Chitinophagaceae bacterium]|nr:DUF3667 domain-containing protein [Chitinophagaceae bacterium]